MVVRYSNQCSLLLRLFTEENRTFEFSLLYLNSCDFRGGGRGGNHNMSLPQLREEQRNMTIYI